MFQRGPSNLFFHDLAPNEMTPEPSLLLVHGFPLDSRIWLDVARALARRHRVIVPDLPGFGQSTTGVPFSMDSLADDLLALMQSLDAPKFTIAGLSMGGYVALTLASRHPEALAGLLMVDSKVSADDDAGKAARNKMIDLVRTQGSAAVAQAMMPKMLHPDAYASRPEIVKTLDTIMRSQPESTIEFACAAMRERQDFTKLVPAFKFPFGVIVGAGDVIAPVSVAASMVQTRGSLFVIENAGHLSPLEEPAAVARAIEAFLLTANKADSEPA